MKLIKLIPGENDKYHFGKGDLTDSPIIFHSHSLYSAIINNLIKLYGKHEFIEIKDGKERLIDDLRYMKVSSLLPAIYKLEDGKLKNFIYFLPKPATKLHFDKETQKKVEEKPKEIKKVQFISVNALKKHNEGKLEKIILGKKFLIDSDDYKDLKDFGIKEPENMKLFKSFIEQKVAIDRIKQVTLEEGKGQLYSVGYVKPLTYTSNNNKNNRLIVGYYFLLNFNGDNNLLKKIESAIRLIKDEGLGGERSNGAGLFKDIIIVDNDKIPAITANNKELPKGLKKSFNLNIKTRMTLSTTIPNMNENGEDEFNKVISYQLMKISGYIYSSSNYPSLTKVKNTFMQSKRGQ